MKHWWVVICLVSCWVNAASGQSNYLFNYDSITNQSEQLAELVGLQSEGEGPIIKCANLIYAGSKSSVCFSPNFLVLVDQESSLEMDFEFTPIKLSSPELFDYPFAVMTGEGVFALMEAERVNLRHYLERGGFLLASAGCSSPEWGRSFMKEFRRIFPGHDLRSLPLDHAVYHTLYEIPRVKLKKNGSALLEGLEMDGRIVLIYSSEGLNDTSTVKGCCCCGGNEVKNSKEINANIITYSIFH